LLLRMISLTRLATATAFTCVAIAFSLSAKEALSLAHALSGCLGTVSEVAPRYSVSAGACQRKVRTI
jgi:hypothetical protein